MTTMKKFLLFFLLLIFYVSCHKNGTGPDSYSDLLDLYGDYLGQEPPGITPVRFTPDALLPDGTWWWISPPKFSPDGRELIFTKYILGNPDTKHIYMMERMENDQWTAPQEVSFGIASGDCHAAFSIDGSKLFFLSHRIRFLTKS